MSERFRPVRAGRSFELVRDALRGAIESGRLRPGDQLPNEPALAQQFGVARSVLREALKALELSGDLEVRRGYGGGTFVAEPRTVEEHAPIGGSALTPAQLFDVRIAIEPACARLAAAAASPRARTLREAVNDMEVLDARPAHVLAADADFHVAVADASGNPVFAATLAALRAAHYRALNKAAQSPAWRERAREDHERIAFEIARHNAALAERLMLAHVLAERDAREAAVAGRSAP